MRNRAWRRYKEDLKVIHRIHKMSRGGWWRRHRDVNNILIQEPTLKDFIGTSYNFMYKNYTTDKHSSRYKSKYSPNRKNSYYRDGDNRERQKIFFLRILKEYELK